MQEKNNLLDSLQENKDNKRHIFDLYLIFIEGRVGGDKRGNIDESV
jgi:hypothetical protein